MGEAKKPWYSKTVILGVLQLVASTAALFGGSELIQQYPKAVATLGAVSAAVAIALRFVTHLPIEW